MFRENQLRNLLMTIRFQTSLLGLGALMTTLGLGGCGAGSLAGQTAETQAAATAAATAAAQSTASQLTGGLTGALGLPNLSGTSASNLTGVLQYCVSSQMTSGNAASLLSSVTQKPGITGNTDYSTGQQGILQAISNQTGTPQQYSLSSLAEPLRQKVCSVVQNRLQNML